MKMKNTEIKTEIEICTDCYFYYHNGSESFNESQHLNDEEKQHIINSFKKLLNGYTEPILFDIDSIIDFFYSSREPCNICMSALHGHRFKMEINIGFNEVKNGKLWNLLTESFEYTFKKIELE